MKEKNNNISGFINIGTYLLNRESLLEYNSEKFSLETDYFPIRIENNLWVGLKVAKFEFLIFKRLVQSKKIGKYKNFNYFKNLNIIYQKYNFEI